MTALLDIPQIRELAAPISVADYHRLTEGRRTELLRGTVIEKMPPSPLHYSTAEELRAILQAQIQPGWLLRYEGPLTFADSEPTPDLCVLRGRKEDFRRAHPTTAEWVIEVAVTSLEIDRVKALIYAEALVQEYWIVCPEARQVEVYRRPESDGYAERTTVSSPAVLECLSVPSMRVDLSAVFA